MTSPLYSTVRSCTAAALLCAAAVDAQAMLIVDRGLPDANLNNAAGGDRSNVAWGFRGDFLAGDDFQLGPVDPGKRRWRIDRLSLWQIGGSPTLGDKFDSVSLFLGPDGASIPKVASANLTGNSSDNPDVSVSQVNYPGTTETYQGSGGGDINLWQVDFEDLGVYDPGELLFAVGGSPAYDETEDAPIVFAHASNAALSGTPQEGADDRYRWFGGTGADASISVGDFLDSEGFGWDKSSDINVQVFASQVPEPMTLALAGTGFVMVGGRRLQAARRAQTQ